MCTHRKSILPRASSIVFSIVEPGELIVPGSFLFPSPKANLQNLFQYEVHASVWWPIIYTDYVATLVYTVDKESGKTIGSELTKPANVHN